MAQVRSSTIRAKTNKGKNDIFFYIHTFLMPQKGSEAFIKPFLGTTKKRRNKHLCHFLFHSIILGCLEQEGLINFFYWDFQKYIKKW